VRRRSAAYMAALRNELHTCGTGGRTIRALVRKLVETERALAQARATAGRG